MAKMCVALHLGVHHTCTVLHVALSVCIVSSIAYNIVVLALLGELPVKTAQGGTTYAANLTLCGNL